MGASATAGASRRRAPELRARIRSGALTVFARRGYEGATTRAIAAEAGVTEPLIFRHFGTKAALYREVVLAPLEALVLDLNPEWSSRRSGMAPSDQEVAVWARHLLGRIHECREPLRALVASGRPKDPPWAQLEAPVGIRAAIGLVFSLVILDPWLWNGLGDEFPPADLAEALTALLTRGVGVEAGCP